jgi:phosphonate transport system substrate-binding protein
MGLFLNRKKEGYMKKHYKFILIVTLLFTTFVSSKSIAGVEKNAEQKTLTLAFIPQENPEKLIGDIKQITKYLEKEIGVSVKGYVTQDHAAAVEALRSGEADISFMGGLPYVLAHNEIGAEVLLSEVYRGRPVYRGRIFVRRDSGINDTKDLEGKSIAFADPISESGYLYPLDIFVKKGYLGQGEDPNNFFKTVYFAGGYQQAIQAVANGLVDAAGVSQFADLLLTPDQLAKVKWIAESIDIPSHVVCSRKNLNSEIKESFKKAMLKLNTPQYSHLLKYVYSPDGYVEATHENYKHVEEMAKLYGYLKK